MDQSNLVMTKDKVQQAPNLCTYTHKLHFAFSNAMSGYNPQVDHSDVVNIVLQRSWINKIGD